MFMIWGTCLLLVCPLLGNPSLTFLKDAEMIRDYVRESPHCPWLQERVQEYIVPEEPDEPYTVVTPQVNHEVVVIVDKERPWLQESLTLRPELNCWDQGDQQLHDTLRRLYLWAPSTEEYNSTLISTSKETSYSEMSQDVFLDTFIFKGQINNGFFIEAGAHDFVSDSNSLFFERAYNWTGILVEPNPTLFHEGLLSKRKAWGASVCLATATRPHFAKFGSFSLPDNQAGLLPDKYEDQGQEVQKHQCFPLTSLLLALGGRTVNYLSLDIEGAEIQVLETIPFDNVDIEIVSVEIISLGRLFPGSRSELHQLLRKNNYLYIGSLADKDDIFVREDLLMGKYQLDIGGIRQDEEWPEYSYWSEAGEGEKKADDNQKKRHFDKEL